MRTDWLVLGQYPFKLLPGTPNKMPDGDMSYYQYVNARWQETGKNILATMFCLEDEPEGLTYVEPFGGCGVFSTAIHHVKKPSRHIISELDEECYKQLVAACPWAEVWHENAHDTLGIRPADVYVCDFPFFTSTRFFLNHEWRPEMGRMITQKPKAINITDGSSARYHFLVEPLRKRGMNVNSDRRTYVRAVSQMFYSEYGYSISRCGYHGTCFYYKLVPGWCPPAEIAFRFFEAGTGPKGLRPA
jgi:hypothetical protein